MRAKEGARVRINLNGRRVGGWIVSVKPFGLSTEGIALEKLSPIVTVSGVGVEPHLIALTQWVSERWMGSWRAVLNSASAPRVREGVVHARRGSTTVDANDAVVIASRKLVSDGGGLLVLPPALSALTVVLSLAETGSVLVVCPTQRMAHLGAAFLRRKGLTTAEIPDEWALARSGVDVVIGARSAVFAPCNNLSFIVVIDEHDESMREERAPTWNASVVAQQRGDLAGIPVVLTSATPSLESLVAYDGRTLAVPTGAGWPRVSIVDLSEIPIAGSLLSSEFLGAIATPGLTTACVLNTKGKARLVVCKSCRKSQNCPECQSLLTQTDQGELSCLRCSSTHGSICLSCGRSAFIVPRGGVTQLIQQVQASSVNPVIEVTGESDDSWTKGNVFIGTEAVLHRVPSAQCVVFADIDRDLGAPRMSAPVEVLALIAKAARMVGANGQVIIQTRLTDHPLIKAFSESDVSSALTQWNQSLLAQRQALLLPPYSVVAKIMVTSPKTIADVPEIDGVLMARDEDEILVRAASREVLNNAITTIRHTLGTHVRVHVDPRRY